MTQDEAAELVRRAGAGDEQAWRELVSGYQALLLSVARGYRLTGTAAQDVVQTAWLRLYEHIGALRRPELVGSWLATVVRRECLEVLRSSRRELPLDDEADDAWGCVEAAEEEVVRAEESRTVRRAVQRLPERQRRLITILTFAPELDYRQVSRSLAMPVGSIGPTRGRALVHLRELLATPQPVGSAA